MTDDEEVTWRAHAYENQMASLQLCPWQFPPCWISPSEIPDLIAGSDPDKRAAAILLRRMHDAGISQFHPDPMAALAAATSPRTGAKRPINKRIGR
jgi:hypothetical protein